MLDDVLLILVGVLLAATTGAAVVYYRQIRRAQKEYEKAKDAVDDIILSFNKQIQQEARKLELVAYRVEAFSSKSDEALKKAGNAEKRVQEMETSFGAVQEEEKSIVQRLEETEKKTRDALVSQETLTSKILEVEQQTKRFAIIPETGPDAVIPIKREKAMAPLTDTEVAVLEMLASEGPKTAPEIKIGIRLSREHTARLMKKLYEGGYLERETGKIPFKYSVKKEMEKLLKKTESKVS